MFNLIYQENITKKNVNLPAEFEINFTRRRAPQEFTVNFFPEVNTTLKKIQLEILTTSIFEFYTEAEYPGGKTYYKHGKNTVLTPKPFVLSSMGCKRFSIIIPRKLNIGLNTKIKILKATEF